MGRNLYHAIRPERGIPQLARLFQLGRRCRLASDPSDSWLDEPEPAQTPALLFQLLRLLAAAAAVAMLGAASVCAETPEKEPPSNLYTAEGACGLIRHDLSRLAEAERDQAFALNLGAAPGSSTALIEGRLAVMLDRTNRLRQNLREVRHNSVPHDPRVEQCTKMGFRALVEAERLTTSVEEFLHSHEIGEASTPRGFRSDAAAAPGSQPLSGATPPTAR